MVLRVHPKSALVQRGWYRSFRQSCPIDRIGRPIPWYTYSAIDFLEGRLGNTHRVLEFGAGYSTLWFSSFVGEVLALEDDPIWARHIQRQLPENAQLVLVDSFAEPCAVPWLNRLFDLVAVDCKGDRKPCARVAVERYLKKDGILIWDNTNRLDSGQATALMRGYGFRELSFTGMCPQSIIVSRTSVFYRPNNCFNI